MVVMKAIWKNVGLLLSLMTCQPIGQLQFCSVFLFRFLLGKTFTFFVYLLDELLTYLLTIIRPSDSGVRGSAEGHQRIFVYFNSR